MALASPLSPSRLVQLGKVDSRKHPEPLNSQASPFVYSTPQPVQSVRHAELCLCESQISGLSITNSKSKRHRPSMARSARRPLGPWPLGLGFSFHVDSFRRAATREK